MRATYFHWMNFIDFHCSWFFHPSCGAVKFCKFKASFLPSLGKCTCDHGLDRSSPCAIVAQICHATFELLNPFFRPLTCQEVEVLAELIKNGQRHLERNLGVASFHAPGPRLRQRPPAEAIPTIGSRQGRLRCRILVKPEIGGIYTIWLWLT